MNLKLSFLREIDHFRREESKTDTWFSLERSCELKLM